MNNLEIVIKESAGLIWKIAKNFYGMDKNDLYQAGVLGVIKAYQNYSNDAKTKFSTYAYSYIYGEMYMATCNKEMKYGKDLIRLVSMIEKGKNILAQKLMKEPTIAELAEFLELPKEKVEYALLSVGNVTSFDENPLSHRALSETVALREETSEDDKLLLKDSINSLNPLEKDIIVSRYYEDLTQSETAKKLGITQVLVSRYESKSLSKMREYMYM
jgi:RNA polymerase sporulation-specific sigma factor